MSGKYGQNSFSVVGFSILGRPLGSAGHFIGQQSKACLPHQPTKPVFQLNSKAIL